MVDYNTACTQSRADGHSSGGRRFSDQVSCEGNLDTYGNCGTMSLTCGSRVVLAAEAISPRSSLAHQPSRPFLTVTCRAAVHAPRASARQQRPQGSTTRPSLKACSGVRRRRRLGAHQGAGSRWSRVGPAGTLINNHAVHPSRPATAARKGPAGGL